MFRVETMSRRFVEFKTVTGWRIMICMTDVLYVQQTDDEELTDICLIGGIKPTVYSSYENVLKHLGETK